ncbi:MAG: 50S ribosomal protein L28 [Planctomycetota bacterium]|jgi:large subunit ribosomal protein L28
MSRVCEGCGKGPTSGVRYKRRGLAKAKGGVGQKVVGKTLRTFAPNIQKVRVRTAAGTVRRMRLCARCIKSNRFAKP